MRGTEGHEDDFPKKKRSSGRGRDLAYHVPVQKPPFLSLTRGGGRPAPAYRQMTPHKGPICLFISGSTVAGRIKSHVIEVASWGCGEGPKWPAGHSWWRRQRQATHLPWEATKQRGNAVVL